MGMGDEMKKSVRWGKEQERIIVSLGGKENCGAGSG